MSRIDLFKHVYAFGSTAIDNTFWFNDFLRLCYIKYCYAILITSSTSISQLFRINEKTSDEV